jgi:hypothetical protein
LAVSVRELIHIVADSSKTAPLRVELADVDGPGTTVQFDAAPVAAELTDLKRTPVYGPSTRNSCTPSSASFLMKLHINSRNMHVTSGPFLQIYKIGHVTNPRYHAFVLPNPQI